MTPEGLVEVALIIVIVAILTLAAWDFLSALANHFGNRKDRDA